MPIAFPPPPGHKTPAKPWRLISIVWAFVAIVLFLMVFAYFSIGTMSAARAYVGGEGLWSKAQKEAVASLSRYAFSHRAQDYADYRQALGVSLGDRQARLALEQSPPQMPLAAAGFLQGRNHPDDIDDMAQLLLYFRHFPEIDRAVSAWTQADALMDQLMAAADRVHLAVQGGALDLQTSQAFAEEIQRIDAQLTPLEDAFSYALGEASRKAKKVLRTAMLALALVSVSVAYLFSSRIVRQIEKIHQSSRDSEIQLHKLLERAPLPIVIVRLHDDAIVYANQRALAQFDVTSDALSAVRPESFYARAQDRVAIQLALQSQNTLQDWEVQLQDLRGNPFWVLLSSQRILFNGQECLMSTLNNIDERKRAQEALRHQAFHDELTGLPNRAMFMDSLNRTLHRAERKKSVFFVLFLDLDHFKKINDSLGHAMGDLLLQTVATRLRMCVREGDLLARLGGDEFVVLVEDDGHPQASDHMAEKIQKALEPEHQLGPHVVRVSASIGVSSYPQDGTNMADLMRHADSAMYRVKETGGSNFCHFSNTPN
jgi:diguanylate cyclase (GGDEF)-like protein/PAS domain S-box-containing protein